MWFIPDGLKTVLHDIARSEIAAHPMSILRTGVSFLSHHDPDVEDNSAEAELRKAQWQGLRRKDRHKYGHPNQHDHRRQKCLSHYNRPTSQIYGNSQRDGCLARTESGRDQAMVEFRAHPDPRCVNPKHPRRVRR